MKLDFLRQGSVPHSLELERILALPRVKWEQREDLDELVELLTNEYRTPTGTMRLWPHQAVALEYIHDYGGALLPLGVGEGKCLGRGTPVLLYDGRIVPVEQVAAGELLMGPDSRPRRVANTTRGVGPLYRVVPIKGDPWVCNDVHMLTVVDSVSGEVEDVELQKFLKWSAKRKNEAKLFQPSRIDWPRQDLPVDPYFLGVWYGDGAKALSGVSISKPDPEIETLCEDIAADWGLRVRVSDRDRCPTYHLVGDVGNKNNPLLNVMRRLVGDASALPREYLVGAADDRLQFLAGILDTDGCVNHSGFEVVQKQPEVAEGIAFLARSLGFRVTSRIEHVNGKPYVRMNIAGDCDRIPTRIPRKKAPPRRQKKNALRTGFKVEPVGEGEYFGFQIDGDGRFLLGDFTVTHNTLISYLAPHVLESKRCAILVPGSLEKKTWRDFAELRKHWRWPDARIEVFSYSKISVVSGENLLNDFKPDLIVADEAHAIRNFGASVTKRVIRYLAENHQHTNFVAMSGTMIARSILDMHHLAAFALGTDQMPLPAPRRECKTWSYAVDEDPPIRKSPGALKKLGGPTPREALGRRIYETPGVLRTTRSSVDASLEIQTIDQRVPVACASEIRRLWKEKTQPGTGHEALPTDLYRHTSTLVWGFYYVWDPEPPAEWLRARKAWARFVRTILDEDTPGLDSELQVANACKRDQIDHYGVFDEWDRVRSTYKEKHRPVWIANPVLPSRVHGLIWVQHRALGERLKIDLDVPFFSQKGLDSRGEFIQDTKEPTVIASIGANATGRNLQYQFAHNVVLNPPANGTTWEQLLGRTHRTGQKADVVTVDVCLGHPAIEQQFHSALANARYLQELEQRPQKLLQGYR